MSFNFFRTLRLAFDSTLSSRQLLALIVANKYLQLLKSEFLKLSNKPLELGLEDVLKEYIEIGYFNLNHFRLNFTQIYKETFSVLTE